MGRAAMSALRSSATSRTTPSSSSTPGRIGSTLSAIKLRPKVTGRVSLVITFCKDQNRTMNRRCHTRAATTGKPSRYLSGFS